MKDYSYTELKEMQDRAMERVRAMQQRASETVSRENSLQEEKPKPDAHTEQNSYTKPHHIKMPVNMPPRECGKKPRQQSKHRQQSGFKFRLGKRKQHY